VADEINSSMPAHVVELIGTTLNEQTKPLRNARVLVLGIAYKSDVNDIRESPALEIIKILRDKHANVVYHDPHVPRLHLERSEPMIVRSRRVPANAPDDVLESVELTDAELTGADCVLVTTAHSDLDYERIGALASTIVDTRHVFKGATRARIVRL